MSKQLIISCEHAGNEVPEEYHHLFQNSDVLNTHRGIDIGARELTNTIAKRMKQEPYLHTVTRLLIDLNRSAQNPNLFSEFTNEQPLDIREDIFEKYYRPHRNKVEGKIKEIISQGDKAVHLSIHTFTSVWDQIKREVDVGFLYDPKRQEEEEFCELWRNELKDSTPELCLKMNEPYLGTMDGFTTYLRRYYSSEQYIGIEIEVSQRFSEQAPQEEWEQLQSDIAESLYSTLQKLN